MATWSTSLTARRVPELGPQLVRVVLIGAPGSGKSRIASALARRLGWRHVDLDHEIERRAGRSIAEIFHREGEAAFRQLEAELTDEVAALERVVVSPGGGWITNPALVPKVRAGASIVWLSASLDTLLARLRASRVVRPLLATPDPRATLSRLLAEREPLYRAAADIIVATDRRAVGEIVAEIVVGCRSSAVGQLQKTDD